MAIFEKKKNKTKKVFQNTLKMGSLKGVYFQKIKNWFAKCKLVKHKKVHFLKQLVFVKASTHYFSGGIWFVFKNARVCARYFGEH